MKTAASLDNKELINKDAHTLSWEKSTVKMTILAELNVYTSSYVLSDSPEGYEVFLGI